MDLLLDSASFLLVLQPHFVFLKLELLQQHVVFESIQNVLLFDGGFLEELLLFLESQIFVLEEFEEHFLHVDGLLDFPEETQQFFLLDHISQLRVLGESEQPFLLLNLQKGVEVVGLVQLLAFLHFLSLELLEPQFSLLKLLP